MIAPLDPHPLPHWDLSNIFGGLEKDDFRHAVTQLEHELTALTRMFDEQGVRRLLHAPAASSALAESLGEAIRRTNVVALAYETLESFISAFVTTNSFDAIAAREMSRLEGLDTRRQQLSVRLKAWIGSLAPALEELLGLNPLLQEHAFFLRDTAQQSQFLMTEELEGLAAEMTVDGANAFAKLQGTVTSQLQVPWETDGETALTPITVIRNLSFDPDESVRRRAYQAEVKGWASIEATVAACLNSVKGTAITLARRRNRQSVLEVALHENRVDQPTLDSLLGAIREHFPLFRRYLHVKAKKLGKDRLAWWDLFAPVGQAHRVFSWADARQFIIDKFNNFAPDMGRLAQRSFDERWIDAEPRSGKRAGAFCMAVPGHDESRVLMNFDGSYEQVSTLAHELGHAYHNECQRGLPALRRGAPATLAETASTFCETLIAEAALKTATPAEQEMILEIQLCGVTQVCIDIYSRFLFESRFIQHRADVQLSPAEICGLMRQAQAETYGEAVDPATYQPYLWVWKPHYYQHGWNFYNFPYAFGQLFALGLYAIYCREGQSFVPRYQQLLRDTAQSFAAPLAARFGVDITQPGFWRDSLKIVAGQLERYEHTTAAK